MNKKHKISILFLLLFLSAACTAVLFIRESIDKSRTQLTVTSYALESGFSQPIRIVQLTDLHGQVFGTDNDILIEKVRNLEPDLICMTGDMLDKTDENADVVCSLIRELSPEFPVWYGYGNHEMSWISETGTDLKPILTEAGACVVNCDYQDIQIKGQNLRIGGYYGYYRQSGMYVSDPGQTEYELNFFNSYEYTNGFKLLLCHIPTAWLDWGYINSCPVDLVLSGHYHGGQIRLPLVGGLYAPYIGLFPDYTDGMFPGQEAVCVLSRGLGSSPGIPRVNNLPEITIIDLIPKQ